MYVIRETVYLDEMCVFYNVSHEWMKKMLLVCRSDQLVAMAIRQMSLNIIVSVNRISKCY